MPRLGPSALLSAVRDLLESETPSAHERTPDPILVLEGCGGSGKSMLLRRTAEWCGDVVPHVFVDPRAINCDTQYGPVSALLLFTAFGLTRHWQDTGTLAFPRLVLAHLAINPGSVDGQAVDIADTGLSPELFERARGRMARTLTTYRDRNRVLEFVGSLANDLGTELLPQALARLPGARSTVEFVAGRLVDRLRASPAGARLSFSDALDWFGHQDAGFHRPPLDELVRLNWRFRNPETATRRDLDEVLVAAFLADLRTGLGRAPQRNWDCALLLDNADWAPAVALLRTLAQVRERQAATGVPPDWLTVLAASTGELLAPLLPEAVPEAGPETAAGGGRPEVIDLTDAAVWRGRMWVRVAMEPLTAADTDAVLSSSLPPTVRSRRLTSHVLGRLTAGHRGATALVLSSLQRSSELATDVPALLSDVGAGGVSNEAALLRQFTEAVCLDRRSDTAIQGDLITLSAAWGRTEAVHLAASPLVCSPPIDHTALLSRTLWAGPDTGHGPVLVAAARYVFLRALAARPPGPTSWTEVFRWLLEEAERDRRTAQSLHHRLALGEVEPVASELALQLAVRPCAQWLALLDGVTATPRPAEPIRPVHALLWQRADWAAPEDQPRTAVAQLVVTLQTLADPRVSAPTIGRDLHLSVAESYRRCSMYSPDRLGALLNRAQRHQELAELYK